MKKLLSRVRNDDTLMLILRPIKEEEKGKNFDSNLDVNRNGYTDGELELFFERIKGLNNHYKPSALTSFK